MTPQLEIELKYYLSNRDKFSNAKKHIVRLYGEEGFKWLAEEIHIKHNKSLGIKRKSSYNLRVRILTEQQPIHLLENFEKRGWNNYHLDHIVSIHKAYKLGWTAEQCADISNLQMLPYKDNLKKGSK